MKYAVTDYDGCEYITAGKRYEVRRSKGINFIITADDNEWYIFRLKECPHLDGNDWRIEMNNDIEQQGNDFEVKYEEYETPLGAFEGILSSFKDIKSLMHEEVEIVRAALQKQPKKSGVTRSDIELRDWYAGQALQGMLAGIMSDEKLVEPDADYVCKHVKKMVDAMMEARK